MNFGQALQGLLSGEFWSISCGRRKGSYIRTASVDDSAARGRGDLYDMEPCLALIDPDGRVAAGWTPTQTDLFRDDWAGHEAKHAEACVEEATVLYPKDTSPKTHITLEDILSSVQREAQRSVREAVAHELRALALQFDTAAKRAFRED
jgi:hypothetical protein